LKIAFDENVPAAMVRVFQTFASERQLRKLSGNFDVKSAKDYTPKPGDHDYVPNSDVPWLKRFAADGGKVVISGDTSMRYQPHERLALIECGFIVIFFENRWSDWKFFRKCALLLHWWPQIAGRVRRAKPGSFYHVPCHWPEKGSLRKVSNKDPRLLKMERQQKKPRKRKLRKKIEALTPPSDGPLFDFAKTETKVADAKEAASTPKGG
jgi:hypothetical protein